MSHHNLELVKAFPRIVRSDAIHLVSSLSEPARTSHAFTVSVSGEPVEIPYRIYHDLNSENLDSLTPVQIELWDCLLTRHHDGFIREEYLSRIIQCDHTWIPPFVVQLIGEYVISIVQLVRERIEALPRNLYRDFLAQNPAFYKVTKQRVMSYWDCYYRGLKKADYPGFQVLEFLDQLQLETSRKD